MKSGALMVPIQVHQAENSRIVAKARVESLGPAALDP